MEIYPQTLTARVEAMIKDKNLSITLQDFEDRYMDYFGKLRNGLSEILKTPHQLVPNTPLSGGAMADFVPTLAAAINSQEPLNIPNIFQASQNEAINKALIKFKSDLGTNMDGRAHEEGKATAAFSRVSRVRKPLCSGSDFATRHWIATSASSLQIWRLRCLTCLRISSGKAYCNQLYDIRPTRVTVTFVKTPLKLQSLPKLPRLP